MLTARQSKELDKMLSPYITHFDKQRVVSADRPVPFNEYQRVKKQFTRVAGRLRERGPREVLIFDLYQVQKFISKDSVRIFTEKQRKFHEEKEQLLEERRQLKIEAIQIKKMIETLDKHGGSFHKSKVTAWFSKANKKTKKPRKPRKPRKVKVPDKIPEHVPVAVEEPEPEQVSVNSFPRVHKKRFGFARRKII